ncbi:hypothetical protein [Nocardioides luteus]|uniref:hypothetical protein n=1 Tax=Nocardioides luteus TaxID=1844 RepID=UPI0018C9CEF7|nr:hypothetical protein [Nocardioides luteus]MBG6095961.1 hypothetical protein [Nocardioides luteus]
MDDSTPIEVGTAAAFRAAFYLTEQYVSLETSPDEGLLLFLEYLRSDPASHDDWAQAVRTALADNGTLPEG